MATIEKRSASRIKVLLPLGYSCSHFNGNMPLTEVSISTKSIAFKVDAECKNNIINLFFYINEAFFKIKAKKIRNQDNESVFLFITPDPEFVDHIEEITSITAMIGDALNLEFSTPPPDPARNWDDFFFRKSLYD